MGIQISCYKVQIRKLQTRGKEPVRPDAGPFLLLTIFPAKISSLNTSFGVSGGNAGRLPAPVS